MQEHEELNTEPTLPLDTASIAQTLLIIPLGAPIPTDLAEAELRDGSLLARLSPLGLPIVERLTLIPISGTELLALDRAWTHLQVNKKVYVLTGLPGARYDVLFDQARRQIGLRSVDWPQIAEAAATAAREAQRVIDKPSMDSNPLSRPARRSGLALAVEALPTPEADDENSAGL